MNSKELREHYLLKKEWPIIGIGKVKDKLVPFVQKTIGDTHSNYVVSYAGSGKYFKTKTEVLEYLCGRGFSVEIDWDATDDIGSKWEKVDEGLYKCAGCGCAAIKEYKKCPLCKMEMNV